MHTITPIFLALLLGLTLAIPFGIDFNVAQNEKAHHSNYYKEANNKDPSDNSRMFVRRGQTFSIYLDDVSNPVSFQLIPYDPVRQDEYQKYAVSVQLVSSISEDPTKWQTQRSAEQPQQSRYDIYVPFQAQVAMYKWVVVNGSNNVPLENELIVLFNPWSPKDDAYVSDSSMIQEYILNTDGMIWSGNSFSFGSMGWDYAQFDYTILDVVMYFLTDVEWESRGDITIVSRALSSWVNVNDNNGLIWGKWFGSYDDGKPPTYWTGSLEIYRQYRQTLRGVKYGQCWVFGGSLTSAGRSIGIAARTITNFDSAHEEQSNGQFKYAMRIDEFLDASGNPTERDGGSIWNFHVWTEYWMTRRDLNNGAYAGWQAVDATPQERSDGLMQMGPTSINAVKAFDRVPQYDTDFVASEVGAKVYRWIGYDTGKQKHPSKNYWLLEIDTDATGHKMSTKAVGRMARNDITSTYKTPSLHRRSNKHVVVHDAVTFEITAPESVEAGDDFSLNIVADCAGCSPSSQSYLEITGLVQMLTYTGDLVHVLRQGTLNVTLDSTHEEQSLKIYAYEYLPYMDDNHIIDYFAFVKFYDGGVFNGVYALKSGRFGLGFPQIILNANNRTSETFSLDISWENPLPMGLTGGIMRIYGSTIAAQDIWVGNVNASATLNLKENEVYHIGDEGQEITVFVKFLTNEIPAVNGQLVIPAFVRSANNVGVVY
jgi:transglutaminase 1